MVTVVVVMAAVAITVILIAITMEKGMDVVATVMVNIVSIKRERWRVRKSDKYKCTIS